MLIARLPNASFGRWSRERFARNVIRVEGAEKCFERVPLITTEKKL